MKNRGFILLFLQVLIYETAIALIIACTNISIDASYVIQPQHTEMAKLALSGNIVAQPQNYNERVYQVCIVSNMKTIPETIVIGCSRGMYLGTEITGYQNLYNNGVSGACLEDYYALLGLYYNKFQKLPQRVIIETSPWIFYTDNPERRWLEDETYRKSACSFYELVNETNLSVSESTKTENPYISMPYFRYNVEQFKENSWHIPKEDARISSDVTEAAKYPDGTIRYKAELEMENDNRLSGVLATNGACTYQNSHLMTEVGMDKANSYVSLIDFLQNNGVEVIIYMQPFSVTQCKYSLDDGLNPGYPAAEQYIRDIADQKNIKLYGSYDARDWGLTDNRFVDSVHLDRQGTDTIWNFYR